MPFALESSSDAAGHIPSLDEWAALWSAWDIVTRGMLPRDELFEKPIKLRNACIFYLGHIPTFLDIQLSKSTKSPPTYPAHYHGIFERGIDPDVDNPEQCHDHSEVPDEWPPLNEITDYQQRVRGRLRDIYARGRDSIPRDIARAIWVGFEHEVMHMETLLYMMLQSDRTLPPPHTAMPDFEALAHQAASARVENEWHCVPEQTFVIGMDDPEDVSDGQSHFGWDNEKPARTVHVPEFEAKGRAITNEEFARYLCSSGLDKIPASWVAAQGSTVLADRKANGTNGASALPSSYVDAIAVRTVYGPVPLRLALDWPVSASYDELSQCAAWMGGRIPTFEEVQSIYCYVNRTRKQKEAERQLGKTVPAVNGHLSNNGVQETPPLALSHLGDEECDLFIDLRGANVGFQHWHTRPVTALGGQLAGQSQMGGVWEWTSSPLRRHEGFEPMALYPAYTADFFDEKHNIVLGGSWATHPKIAGRRSFVNWYQRNYPYAWVGARIVRDVPIRNEEVTMLN